MAVLTVGQLFALHAESFHNDPYASLTVTGRSATALTADFSATNEPYRQVTVHGIGFTYDAQGRLQAGTITGLVEYRFGQLAFDLAGIAVPVATVQDWFTHGSSYNAIWTIFAAADRILGSPLDDRLEGEAGDDHIEGGGGSDRLWGETGDDRLLGGAGDDDLRGQEGDDWLAGEAGDDTLDGWTGDDVLVGGAGDDLLFGHAGRDTALFGGLRGQYTLRPGGTTAQRIMDGPEGRDDLFAIENLGFVDGRITFDPYDDFSKAYRLYFAALDRAGDPLGLNHWARLLDGHLTMEAVAAGFVDSPEFQVRYGALSPEQFVAQLYWNVLDRGPDPAGAANWAGQLAGGLSRAAVLVGFSESPEHILRHLDAVEAGLWDLDETAASIARLYHGVLDRAPDAPGLVNWRAAAAGGMSLETVAGHFVTSPEFVQLYGGLDDGAFVHQLYLNVLDRAADGAGAAHWLGLLEAGATRAGVTLGFTESLEFQISTLATVEDGILIA